MLTLILMLILTLKEHRADVANLFGFPGYGRLGDPELYRHHAFLPQDVDTGSEISSEDDSESSVSTEDSTSDSDPDYDTDSDDDPVSNIFRRNGDLGDGAGDGSDSDSDVDSNNNSNIGIGSKSGSDHSDVNDTNLVYPLAEVYNGSGNPSSNTHSITSDSSIVANVGHVNLDNNDSITFSSQDNFSDPFSDIYLRTGDVEK
ncbi:hypothetical protein K501DRAFT_270423 [Backusella circina FSU 941]|nr:hypothetical protein K501DRAFT_270423 [Backusella circina FSU 941]